MKDENNEVKCIHTDKTVQEFYGVENDICPICDEKIITPINGFVYKGKIYHLNCAHEFRDSLPL